MKKGYQALVDEAMAEVRTYTVEEVASKRADPNVQLVDVRDIRELERDGTIPGAVHAPRGMLEFWIDPDSPYYRELFGSDKEFIFFCAAGMRSALSTKTVQDMGMPRVAHLGGGFAAWKANGGEIEPRAVKA